MSKQLFEEKIIDKLSNIAELSKDNFMKKITEDQHKFFDNQKNSILEYLKSNTDFENYTEDEKNEKFNSVIELFNIYSKDIKTCESIISFTGFELKTIIKLLNISVKYDSTSIYYGLHLKKYFLSNLPEVTSDSTPYDINITFSHAVTLHHLLSTITLKGLTKDSIAFANIIFELGEVIRIYDHYNAISSNVYSDIDIWNRELSKDKAEEVKKLVAQQLLDEELKKQ